MAMGEWKEQFFRKINSQDVVMRLGMPCATCVLMAFSAAPCIWAQHYRLVVPGGEVSSAAHVTDQSLQVTDEQGQIHNYGRDTRFDSADGQWLAYHNRQTQRVLLWPSSHQGNLQIGTWQGGAIRFNRSRMQIQASGSIKSSGSEGVPTSNDESTARSLADIQSQPMSGPLMPQQSPWSQLAISDYFAQLQGRNIQNLPEAKPMHLVSFDSTGVGWAVAQRGLRLGCVSQVLPQTIWWLAPVGPDLVRLQLQIDHQVWSVAATQTGGLALSMLAQDARQLWRVSPSWLDGQRYVLENAFYPNSCLTHSSNGELTVRPWAAAVNQQWIVLTPQAVYLDSFPPFWRSHRTQIRPNPRQSPIEIELVNSHDQGLIALLGHRGGDRVEKTIRIEPKQSQSLQLERDTGATLIETVEVLGQNGQWSQRQYETSLPSVSHYDLSVYEEFLQSIAIDRTGKNPNPIEDANYVPRSIGLIFLAIDSQLSTKMTIDVYAKARSANNPGAVRRMDKRQLEKPPQDPVKSILEGIQKVGPPDDSRRSF